MKKILFKSMLFAFATVTGLSANANGYPIVTLPYTFNATNSVGDIDIDRDGHADFYVEFHSGSNNYCTINAIGITSTQDGSLGMVSGSKVLSQFIGEYSSNGGLQSSLPEPFGYYTSMLSSGFSISSIRPVGLSWASSSRFFGVSELKSSLSGTYYSGAQSGYVGVQFLIDGDQHYGWLNVVIDPNGQFVTINSAGYQASAGLPAVAGLNDPFAVPVPIIASLLGLAAIGGGIFLKRRKKNVC
jgi:hypothetical protein